MAGPRPWRILVVIEFDEEERALQFERYLVPGAINVAHAASADGRSDALPIARQIAEALEAAHVTADGQRFLTTVPQVQRAAPASISVILNWPALLNE